MSEERGERVLDTADLPSGEVRVVTCGGRSIALANVDGEVHAIDNVCTHDAGPLGEGRLVNGRVICPRHGAAFDPQSGRALTLPAVGAVRTYPVTVDDGALYVRCKDGEA